MVALEGGSHCRTRFQKAFLAPYKYHIPPLLVQPQPLLRHQLHHLITLSLSLCSKALIILSATRIASGLLPETSVGCCVAVPQLIKDRICPSGFPGNINMSSTFTDSLRLSASSSFSEMDNKPTEKQGIVTILGSDLVCDRNKATNSLRRTLSADMSSKKWLAQNGFSPMKKIASSEEISVAVPSDSSSSSEGEEEEEEYCGRKFNIWSEKKNKEEVEKPEQFDIWSSIILQKATEDPSKSLLPPYIHPLVKRSASTLNENSLKICTESLGSETGSDGFSSYPASEASCDIEEVDKEEEEEEEEQQVKEQSQTFFNREDHYGAVKFNHGGGGSRKSLPASRSFPPPIPSLSPTVDGASLRMQTRRDNGRLVLEAVSIPTLKNFRAERQEGRLVLTFRPASSVEEIPMVHDQEKQSNEEGFDEKVVNFDHEEEEEEEREIINIDDDDDDDDDEEDEEVGNENKFNQKEFVMEESSKLSRVLNVHRLAIVMNKPNGLPNRNVPAWPSKFNGVIATKLEGDDDEEQLMVPKQVAAQSLPPRVPVSRMIPSSPAAKVTGTATSATASLNAYEYYWRAKPTATAVALNHLQNNNTNTLILSKNQMANEQQNLAVFRGNKGDNMVPLLNGCKKPRTSLLFWEPCCIATS